MAPDEALGEARQPEASRTFFDDALHSTTVAILQFDVLPATGTAGNQDERQSCKFNVDNVKCACSRHPDSGIAPNAFSLHTVHLLY